MSKRKDEWLAEFGVELQRLREGMNGKLGASIALLQWAADPTADPVKSARTWAARQPKRASPKRGSRVLVDVVELRASGMRLSDGDG